MRKNLSKSETKELNDKILVFGIILEKKEVIVYIKDENIEGYLRNNKLFLAINKDVLFPTLKYIISENLNKIPSVTIDMPAVKFITNGADIMRPGIKEIDDFPENSVIVVRDEIHKKPLAIAFSRKNSQDLKIMEKGKVLDNLNYVGDKIWNYN